MRKELFEWPLEGWAYDKNGEIYTRSGYTTSAQHLEAALWIMGILLKQYAKDAIYSDERPRATRALLDLGDLGERFSGKKARSNQCSTCKHAARTQMDHKATRQQRPRRG